jgi:hypothetical protein
VAVVRLPNELIPGHKRANENADKLAALIKMPSQDIYVIAHSDRKCLNGRPPVIASPGNAHGPHELAWPWNRKPCAAEDDEAACFDASQQFYEEILIEDWHARTMNTGAAQGVRDERNTPAPFQGLPPVLTSRNFYPCPRGWQGRFTGRASTLSRAAQALVNDDRPGILKPERKIEQFTNGLSAKFRSSAARSSAFRAPFADRRSGSFAVFLRSAALPRAASGFSAWTDRRSASMRLTTFVGAAASGCSAGGSPA